MAKSTATSKKLRTQLKKRADEVSMETRTILDGLLDELERVENIRDALYTEYTQETKPTDEYTNKAGATNLVISPVIKEYKLYSKLCHEIMVKIHSILESIPPPRKGYDALSTLIARPRT